MHYHSLGSWVLSVLLKGLTVQDPFCFDLDSFDQNCELVNSASITILIPNFYLYEMGFGSVLQLSNLVLYFNNRSVTLRGEGQVGSSEICHRNVVGPHVLMTCDFFPCEGVHKFQISSGKSWLTEVCGKTCLD